MMAKKTQPEKVFLSNGIPVILQNDESPVAATYWWVKVGSADEKPNEAGFAHFLEHMLFKDASAKESGKASTGQTARAIESLGGDINAYTAFDQTVYHVTCAAQHWEKILDQFGPMAKPQKFLKADFEREREVILEELRKNEDSPGRQLFQQLFSATFAKHPYGRPVIGFVKTLNAAKLKDLSAFYERNYIASKMGLILVGPIEGDGGKRKKAILGRLEKYFGQKVIKKPSPKKVELSLQVKRPPEPALRKGSEWRIKKFDVKSPTVSVSFRVPELSHPDLPAIDLLSSILGMGELSRLYQRLFYRESLVTEVSAGLYVPKDPGMLYFQAEMDSIDKIESVTRGIFEELRRIQEEGPTAEELSRVLVNAESERLYSTQTADGMASRLGFLEYVVGDLSFDLEYLDQLRAVDSNRIKEVAKKYFDFHRMNAAILVPEKVAGFDTTALQKLAQEMFPGQSSASDTETSRVSKVSGRTSEGTAAGPVHYLKLPSGLELCYYHRPQSHVFSIYATALGGLRLELAHPIESAETDWGASSMLASTWAKGTSRLDSRAIAAVIEGSAASLDGFSGRNTVGLQMTGLARDWNKLAPVFTEVLLDPSFPEEELEHSRRITEDSIRSIDDHSSQLCSKLFLETLFESHPYGKLTYGSLDSLKVLMREKIRAFHRTWVRPERLVISVSGPVPPSVIVSWVHELDRKAQTMNGKTSVLMLPNRLDQEPDLKGPRWVEKSLGREQSHILVGGLGTDLLSEDRYTLRLLQTLLGGQSGRLFIELREKKSLAYTVAPVHFEGLERGYVGTYIACSPDKKDEAIQGIRSVLEQLAEKGPTRAEMERSREFFMGRRAMELQSDPSLAAHYGLETLYQLPKMTEAQLIKRIRSVTDRDVKRLCKKYFVDPFQVTSIVG